MGATRKVIESAYPHYMDRLSNTTKNMNKNNTEQMRYEFSVSHYLKLITISTLIYFGLMAGLWIFIACSCLLAVILYRMFFNFERYTSMKSGSLLFKPWLLLSLALIHGPLLIGIFCILDAMVYMPVTAAGWLFSWLGTYIIAWHSHKNRISTCANTVHEE